MAKRQPRVLEVHVSFETWGFDSPSDHRYVARTEATTTASSMPGHSEILETDQSSLLIRWETVAVLSTPDESV